MNGRTHKLVWFVLAARAAEVVAALIAAHPYEEVAFDLYLLVS